MTTKRNSLESLLWSVVITGPHRQKTMTPSRGTASWIVLTLLVVAVVGVIIY